MNQNINWKMCDSDNDTQSMNMTLRGLWSPMMIFQVLKRPVQAPKKVFIKISLSENNSHIIYIF